MPFWESDFPATLLDFGYVVQDVHGTEVRGILAQEDVVQNDGSGDVIVRSTVLTVAGAALPDVAQGDVLTTWAPDAPTRTTSWNVRRVLVRQDGTPTRLVLALR